MLKIERASKSLRKNWKIPSVLAQEPQEEIHVLSEAPIQARSGVSSMFTSEDSQVMDVVEEPGGPTPVPKPRTSVVVQSVTRSNEKLETTQDVGEIQLETLRSKERLLDKPPAPLPKPQHFPSTRSGGTYKSSLISHGAEPGPYPSSLPPGAGGAYNNTYENVGPQPSSHLPLQQPQPILSLMPSAPVEEGDIGIPIVPRQMTHKVRSPQQGRESLPISYMPISKDCDIEPRQQGHASTTLPRKERAARHEQRRLSANIPKPPSEIRTILKTRSSNFHHQPAEIMEATAIIHCDSPTIRADVEYQRVTARPLQQQPYKTPPPVMKKKPRQASLTTDLVTSSRKEVSLR